MYKRQCKDWELYIHDDGSTDNTIAAVENYVEKYPYKIHLIDGKSVSYTHLIGEKFIGDDTVAMVLGDNIFAGHGLNKRRKAAVENAKSGKGATVFGYSVDDPESCLL